MEENIEPKPDQNADDFMKASAEEWSKDIPSESVPQTGPTENDRLGNPVASENDDPGRWSGELYNPETDPAKIKTEFGEEWSEAKTTKPQEPVIVDVPTNNGTPTSAAPAPKQKENFPVWAIVLIVVLVLCLCLACPLVLLLTGVFSWMDATSLLIPIII